MSTPIAGDQHRDRSHPNQPDRDESFPSRKHRDEDRDPDSPTRPGAGRHLVGALLGLAMTPVALLLTGIGTARLGDVNGAGGGATDALGLGLLLVGVALLAALVLLATWSPAVPIAGGLVWALGLAVAYLLLPSLVDSTLGAMTGDQLVPAALEQLTRSAMSGHLLITGTLLVAAGIAAGQSRHQGRRFAQETAAAERTRPGLQDHERDED